MSMFRNRYLQAIDAAHSDIVGAEMLIAHSFTSEAQQRAEYELFKAQRSLAEAVAAHAAWQNEIED